MRTELLICDSQWQSCETGAAPLPIIDPGL